MSIRDWDADRQRMIADQLRSRDVRDERVLGAISRVERHRFIPEDARSEAYEDHPVPIGHGQTISQPYIVGFMTQALDVGSRHRVLEIGTGCGYQTAVLAELARDVFSIEVVPELAANARVTLTELGYHNVHIRVGDGYDGWPEEPPFDRILGAAAPPAIPPILVDQLADDGILVLPVGDWHQEIKVIQKRAGQVLSRDVLPVRFVPMVRR
ncbi:MAG TPA: protein-L-isoaspartate(D-aspartate) O-methyltransferase [Vicinamibacterales bacterium]